MGLAERRAIKAFQDNLFPGLKKAIDEAAGFEVTVEVDWPTLAEDDYSHMYDEALPKVYFQPVAEAFKGICIDDMGRDALKEGLEKVVIRHSGNKELSFKDGVLTVDHPPIANADYWEERRDTLQKALEKAL